VLRGQESFGQAVAFGLNTKKWKGGRVPLGVTTALLVLSVYPTWLVVRDHVPIEAADAKAPVDDLALQQVVTLEEKRKFAEGEAALGRNV
jgi:hypothetical protein